MLCDRTKTPRVRGSLERLGHAVLGVVGEIAYGSGVWNLVLKDCLEEVGTGVDLEVGGEES